MNTNKFFLILILAFLPLFAINVQGAAVEGEEVVQGDTIKLKSHILDTEIKTTVILPAQYFDEEMQEEQYPVVYLLHGYAGDYSSWSKIKPNIDALATDLGFIFVCPDGKKSWYWDSPIDKKSQFESYITQELVPYIDDNYRTMPTSQMRAITGLSMGGHGAFWLAIRHPELFSIVGCMSGGVNILPFAQKWNMKELLGDYDSNKERWNDYTVINLVPKLKKGQLKIIFDCGVSDFFYDVNLGLHKALLEKGIEHDFISRPGVHNWDYWRNSLDYQLLFFQKAFEAHSAN
ncbi:MAG: alpha/beta hydrolase family protein [Muribaculaceae bacterium]|nr:alpha/beta hydrolase family protein [Muribaculaceae bacterium]